MRCPKCNTENREDAIFCGNCGNNLSRACPRCGRELASDSRFCDKCGTHLAASQAPAVAPDASSERLKRLVPKEYAERLLATRGKVAKERRLVTMLFSDVKGSSAMAREIDPEDWAEIMDGAFDFLIKPIYRYEGTLARLMGDAILAFFGAPIAHEDDPERACRAALDIIEGAAEYGKRLQEERGIAGFNVRVGIHTGLVVVGEAGSDLRVEYTAMGDAINLASRMEGAAEPGTVLITEETHKLIAPLFETQALGSIEVKGQAQPVAVYRVLSAREAAGKVRGIAGLESPLVGREAEFAALREALERLQAGVGGIVTIVGEAGIGKSRLVAEARVGAIHESPLQWVESRCLSYGSTMAYGLWLDVLRSLLGVTLDSAAEEMAEVLRKRVRRLCPDRFDDVYPYLARLTSLPLSEELAAKLEDMDGADLKASTFRAVERLIECAASEQPLALVCEDLHWADQTSIELLEQLLSLTDRAGLLFICIFRPRKEHGSWRIEEAAARTYGYRHTDLELQPLSASESDVLVGNLLRIEQLQPALKQRILDAAEGNPFYVEEILRSMIDQQAIVRDDATGRWQATESAVDIPIPDTLQGVLIARIDRLQEDTRRVLQMASVIGRLFLYRVLEAIAEEERRLDQHLITLQREEMIRERARIPELEYIFKHELTREAAYNGLLKKERRAFHRQVAQALERLFPDRIEEQLGLLAYHWEWAGDGEKAVHYLQRAGDQARLMYSQEEAIDYYERALAVLTEEQDLDQAARTWMKLGYAYHSAFHFKESREAYEQGFNVWQRAATQERAVLPSSPHALRLPRGSTVGELRTDNLAEHLASFPALFSGLVENAGGWTVVPDVAARWQTSDDGRRYVFHLRDDARWSDGKPVTAHDFEFAWKRVLDPNSQAPLASLLYDIVGARAFHQGAVPDASQVGVRTLDEATLEVDLEEPTGYFLQVLATPVTHPVPRHVVEKQGERWAEPLSIVTNGPFRFESWQEDSGLLTLVRNPTYHGRFGGNVQRVEMSVIFDFSTLLDSYESCEFDLLQIKYQIPERQRKLARQRHASERIIQPTLATPCLVFDVSQPPFDDVRVRRAFALATDRESWAAEAWGGYPLPASGGFVPPGMPGHVPDIALPHDPGLAQHLLAEAGYPQGHGFAAMRYMTWRFEEVEAITEHLLGPWRRSLGVHVSWQAVPWEEYGARVQQERPHIWVTNWRADLPDPDNFLRVAFSIWSNWRHEPYDKLVEEARRLTDQAKRLRLYVQAERILVDQVPILPLIYLRYDTLVKPWVRLRSGLWKDVIIEPH